MENQREWQAWWSQIGASGAVRRMSVLRQHPSTWQQQKDATDAWSMLVGFTILSSTFLLTPSAHVAISSLTTQQNSSAILLLCPPPEGHSLVINAETSVGASGSDLWQKIRDRWRARRAERDKSDEGRRGDGEHELGAEGICQGRQQEHGREATHRRRGAVFMCWMIKQETPKYKKPTKQLRAYSELTASRSSRDSGVHGPVASAVGERQHSESSKRGGSLNLEQT